MPGYLPLSFFHSNCADIILMDLFLQLWSSIIFRLLVVPAPFIALSSQPSSPYQTVHCAPYHLVIIVSLIVDIAHLMINIAYLIIDITHLLIDTVSLIASSSLCSYCLVISMSLVVVAPPSPLHLHANHAPQCPIVFILCWPSQMCLQMTRYCFPFQFQSPYHLLALVLLMASLSLHPLPPWNLFTPCLLVIFVLLAVFMPLTFYAPYPQPEMEWIGLSRVEYNQIPSNKYTFFWPD